MQTEIENNVPNLDALDISELWSIYNDIREFPWKTARKFFPTRPIGYIKAIESLSYYTANKATAMKCRLDGKIATALIYESICDTIYGRLPEWARW